MKAGCVGFLVCAGFAVWFFSNHPEWVAPLLTVGGVLFGIFLVLFFIWRGIVEIRCFFRF